MVEAEPGLFSFSAYLVIPVTTVAVKQLFSSKSLLLGQAFAGGEGVGEGGAEGAEEVEEDC